LLYDNNTIDWGGDPVRDEVLENCIRACTSGRSVFQRCVDAALDQSAGEQLVTCVLLARECIETSDVAVQALMRNKDVAPEQLRKDVERFGDACRELKAESARILEFVRPLGWHAARDLENCYTFASDGEAACGEFIGVWFDTEETE
jgi:hypothetical protein